jgi:hypothetical protein
MGLIDPGHGRSQGEAVDTSTGHIGFRCIVRPSTRDPG